MNISFRRIMVGALSILAFAGCVGLFTLSNRTVRAVERDQSDVKDRVGGKINNPLLALTGISEVDSQVELKKELSRNITDRLSELRNKHLSGDGEIELNQVDDSLTTPAYYMGYEELDPYLSMEALCDAPVDYSITCTFTIDRGLNDEVVGTTFYAWPYISNSSEFYMSDEYPAGHYETFSPFQMEYYYSDVLLETVSFDGSPTESVEITFDLPFQGDNYVTLYLFDTDYYYDGFAGDFVGDGMNGPYTVDTIDTTPERISTNDFYEILKAPVDTGYIWDDTASVEANPIEDEYTKYITTVTGSRMFQGFPADGYESNFWVVIVADSDGTYEVFDGDSVEVDPAGSPILLVSIFEIETTPVYRFWSNRYRHHFFTTSEGEKNQVMQNLSHDWAYEGPAFRVAPLIGEGCPVYTSPVYRFWSPVYRGHFYTASEDEKNVVIATLSHDWTYEGKAYCVDLNASVMYYEIYRFWSPVYRGHFYTVSEDEKDYVEDNLSHDWTFEGTSYYVMTEN